MGLCASSPDAKYAAPDRARATKKDGVDVSDLGLTKANQETANTQVIEIPDSVKASKSPEARRPNPPAAAAPDCCSLAIPEPVTNPPTELIGNLIDPINGPAAGLPYKVHYLGPPRPPCEAERLATTKALGRIDDPSQDPEIMNILQLCSNIFGAPASLCALFDDKRVFISEQDGGIIPRGTFPWRWTLCGWSLAFKNPQILVIPDTKMDARFANNLKVTQEPHIRFYCGAPLVASNGHRLGTLCFADVKPRVFDQAGCMIMNNLSELVVRQLEKGLALKAKSKDNSALAATFGHLQRSFDAFEHCVVLLDVAESGAWKVLYSNAALEKLTGIPRNEALGCLLQDLFEEGNGSALPSAGLAAAIESNKSHRVKVARVKPGKDKKGDPKSLVLHFRPAAKEHLDDFAMPIGVPSFLPVTGAADGASSSLQKLYFMTVDVAGYSGTPSHGSGTATANSFLYSSIASSIEMEGLDVGHLLGKGTFGSVYYGTWYGSPVAIKIIESDASKTAPLLEALLSEQLKHEYIVPTLKYLHTSIAMDNSIHDSAQSGYPGASTGGSGVSWLEEGSGNTPVTQVPGNCSPRPTQSPGSGSGEFGMMQRRQKEWRRTLMIMEYADRGSLQEALDRGWLYADRAKIGRGPNLDAVLATAAEVASALSYLHSRNVVHGDLSGWNIMLSSEGSTATLGSRGFVAKVADFGLSRSLDMSDEIMTKSYGTLTHQPPETLTKGIIGKATDVYSYGVLLWQMFTGSRPWSGLSHAQIIMQVGNQGAKLKWPTSTPEGFKALAQACMHSDVSVRPSFEDVVRHVAMLQREVAAAAATPELSLDGEWV